MNKSPFRSILVLLTIVTFVSASQAAPRTGEGGSDTEIQAGGRESVFFAHGGRLDLSRFARATDPMLAAGTRTSFSDTLEIYEIELPPEKKTVLGAKKVAAYLIVAAFVGYALYLFLDPGDRDTPADDTGGKPGGPF